MPEALPDPKRRFSDRVDYYTRFRPGYPPEVINHLRTHIGLDSSWHVADVGSGTGLSSRLFLDHGHQVYAIEPNVGMREAAERLLASNPRFHSIDGSAEETTLPTDSIDLAVAAQAFHWFNPAGACEEFARILRPYGWILLMWNRRLTEATPFLRAYEELLLRYGTDYQRVRHDNVQHTEVASFFRGSLEYRSLKSEQRLTLDALKGRLLSSSYTPGPGQPNHQALLDSLQKIFDDHDEAGRVVMKYSVDLYYGRV